MILFLYLYITLSVVNISKCEFLEEDDISKVYLIVPRTTFDNNEIFGQNNFTVAAQLNTMFYQKCSDFYDIQFEEVDPIDRVKKILKLANEGRNVIDLFTPNYGINTENPQNIIYAGAVFVKDKMQDVFMANFTINNVNQEEIRNDTESVWMKDKSTLFGAKIMSKKASAINSGDLLDFVTKIEYTSSGVKTRQTCLETSIFNLTRPIVLVCSDTPQHWMNIFDDILIKNNYIMLKFVTNCQQEIYKYKNHLLAVLAPKPFEFDTELMVPTIFYDSPYLNPEYKTWFPNSMNLVPGHLLKYAFIELIEDYGWERVGIISDDSPYSIELENELIQLFDKNRIVYNVQRCEERQCNFKKAVENLSKMKARIVIANVDEDNAKIIYDLNKYLKKYRFNLVFRVPPFKENWDHYFITLEPVDEANSICGSINSNCRAIFTGLQKVMDAYVLYNKYQEIVRDGNFIETHKFYSEYAEYMLKQRDTKAIANVRTGRNKVLLTMYINNNGIYSQTVNTYVKAPKIPPDNYEGCFIKSNDFVKYCDVDAILFIMLLVVMFVIMVLTISCYFHSTSPINSIQYQQF